jgi:hypothetical protein
MEKALDNKNKNISLSRHISDNYDWELISKVLIKNTI